MFTFYEKSAYVGVGGGGNRTYHALLLGNCFQFLMDSSSQTSYENERKKLLNRDFSEGNLRAASVLDCVLVAT